MLADSGTITTVTFKQIFVDAGCEWARLLWEDDTGRVLLVSSYGSWSYRWTHIGDQSLASFLGEIGMEYAGEKFMGDKLREYSQEKTIQFIRESILEYRRDGSISKKEAAKEWELVGQLESGHLMDFREWVESSSWNDAYEYHLTEVSPLWKNFWTKLWEPQIKPILLKEEDGEH